MTEQLERRVAVFTPHVLDDLVEGAHDWIGVEGTWQACWIIEEGPYRGQWAWAWLGEPYPPFAWTPECDLTFTDGADA